VFSCGCFGFSGKYSGYFCGSKALTCLAITAGKGRSSLHRQQPKTYSYKTAGNTKARTLSPGFCLQVQVKPTKNQPEPCLLVEVGLQLFARQFKLLAKLVNVQLCYLVLAAITAQLLPASGFALLGKLLQQLPVDK